MPAKRIGTPLKQKQIRLDRTLRAELQTEMDFAGLALLRAHNRFVTGFKNKPRFSLKKVLTRYEISVTVAVDKRTKAGRIYNWIDKGTGRYGVKKRAYEIKPKPSNKSGLLSFRTQYIPKTAPIAKVGGLGKAVGQRIRVKRVMHPGIKPRKFSQTIEKKLNPPFKRRIDNAIRRSVRRA